MRVVPLGTATPHPTADSACSGYLVQTGGATVWVDAGAGTMQHLLRHCALNQVDAIWISHLHADHVSDLAVAYYGYAYGAGQGRWPLVLGPPGWVERIETAVRSNRPNPMDAAFRCGDLADGAEHEVGDLLLRSVAVEHNVDAFALRIEHSSGVLAYSGDTRACDGLVRAATGADLLVCEAGAADDEDPARAVHCTPEDAARTATAAGAARLLLTHVDPAVPPEEARRRAGGVTDVPVQAAAPHQEHRVGSTGDVGVVQVALDDPRLAALRAELWAELYARYPEAEPGSRADEPGTVAWIALTAGGEPAGCAVLSPFEPARRGAEAGPTMEVRNVFTPRTHRRGGIARRLMTTLEQHAVAAGTRWLVLETGTNQAEALALYQGLGYVRCPSLPELVNGHFSVCLHRRLPEPHPATTAAGGAVSAPGGS
jgi:ribonuclease BN (tRNA processing enzyme)/ribosomal protein S18 acetylase RimI-like enzyme